MTDFLDTIGVRAVFENLQGYISANNSAEASTNRLLKAQLNLEATSIKTAQAEVAAAENVANSELRLTNIRTNNYVALAKARAQLSNIITRSAQQEAVAEERALSATAKANAPIRFSSTGVLLTTPAKQAANDAASVAAESRFANLQVNNAERIAAAEARVAQVQVAGNQRLITQHQVIDSAEVKSAAVQSLAAIQKEKALIAVEQITGKTAQSTNLLSGAAGFFSSAAGKAEQATSGLGRAMIAVTGFGNRFAVALRFGAVALGGFLAGFAISSAAKFQDSLTKIDNLTNLTTQDTGILGKTILEMSKTIPKTPDELGAAAYVILSSGISDAKEATDILRNSAKAAVAGFGDTKEIAIAVTGVINSYGLANISAAQATDILFAGVKEGRAEISDFATNIGRVTPIARNLGIEFDQVVAAVAGLTNVGLPARQAVTALLDILQNLEKPSKAAKDTLAEVGLTVEGLRKEIREKGLLPALEDMLKAFGNNDEALVKIFPSVRGLTGALALLRDNGEANTRILNQVSHSAGIVDEAFKNTSKNFSFQAGLLRNALNRAFIELGSAALPAVTKAAQDLNVWIEKNRASIINFIEQGVKTAITFVRLFITGLGALNRVLQEIAGNRAAIVGTLLAIGVAGVIAFGWIPATIAGLIAVIGILDRIKVPGFSIGLQGPGNEGKRVDIVGTLLNNPILNPLGLLKGHGAKDSTADNATTDFQKQMDAISQSVKDTANNLTPIAPDFNDIALGAGGADKAIKKLTGEFQSTSEAAGQVEDVLSKSKLFGSVAKDLADSFGLSAVSAGAIQGIDAVIRAQERGEKEAYNYTLMLSTVANAFKDNAFVAQRIVLELARNALSTAIGAASDVFGKPTREVADLNVTKTQLDAKKNEAEFLLKPQLEAFKKAADDLKEKTDIQTRAIDDSISAIKDETDARKSALSDEVDALKNAADAANKFADAQLEALDKQQKAADRAYSIQKDTLQQAVTDTGKRIVHSGAELKARDLAVAALQEQIRVLDAGNKTQGFLFDDQKTAIKDKIDKEKEASDAQIKSVEAQIKVVGDSSDAQVKALEHQKKAVEDSYRAQEDATKKQEAAVQAQIDSYGKQTDAIDRQIGKYDDNAKILKAQVEAANKTLLSEEDQKKKIEELTGIIGIESGVVRDLSNQLGKETITSIDEARKSFDLLKGAVDVLNDKDHMDAFITNVNAAALRLQFLADAAGGGAGGGAAGAIGGLGNSAANAKAQLDPIPPTLDAVAKATATGIADLFNVASAALNGGKTAAEFLTSTGQRNAFDAFAHPQTTEIIPPIPPPSFNPLFSNPDLGSFAEGGYISRNQLAMLHSPEIIIPLGRPTRAKELMASLPSGILQSIMPKGGGSTNYHFDQIVLPNVTNAQEFYEGLQTIQARQIRTQRHGVRS